MLPLAFVSTAIVPSNHMTGWLRAFTYWNPVSVLTTACRHLFGNPTAPAPQAASQHRTEKAEMSSTASPPADFLRTYSVWDHDPRAGTIDLCVLNHGDGPGARWSRQVKAGDEVSFGGPRGSSQPGQPPLHRG